MEYKTKWLATNNIKINKFQQTIETKWHPIIVTKHRKPVHRWRRWHGSSKRRGRHAQRHACSQIEDDELPERL